MKTLLGSIAIGLGALVCQSVYAQDSTATGHTAQCKDGTYFDGATHKGACKGHQGVKEWLDKGTTATDTDTAASSDTTATKTHHKKSADTAASTTTPATTATAAAPATPATPATAATGSTATSAAGKSTPPNPKDIPQKAGGGNGLVWVNTSDKIYHCEGDEWYGKTKQGKYETAAQAQAEGAHVAKNSKNCGK